MPRRGICLSFALSVIAGVCFCCSGVRPVGALTGTRTSLSSSLTLLETEAGAPTPLRSPKTRERGGPSARPRSLLTLGSTLRGDRRVAADANRDEKEASSTPSEVRLGLRFVDIGGGGFFDEVHPREYDGVRPMALMALDWSESVVHSLWTSITSLWKGGLHGMEGSWPIHNGVDYKCKGWRKTLECDPSGVRDTVRDKKCDAIVKEGESGWCECGNVTTIPGTGCTHEPFTCEQICYKLAIIAGDKTSVNKLKASEDKLKPHVLDEFKRAMTPPPIKGDTIKHVQKLVKSAEDKVKVIAEKGLKATDNIQKAMQANEEYRVAFEKRVLEAQAPGGKPLWQSLDEAGKAAEAAGKQAQAVAGSLGFSYDHPIDYARRDKVEAWAPPLPAEIMNSHTAGGVALP